MTRRLGILAATLLGFGLGGTQGVAQESAPPRWWDGTLSVATGFDYSSGDYERDDDTDIVYVPFSVIYLMEDLRATDYERDQLELRLTIPYLQIRGPGEFFVDGSGTFSQTRTKEEGIGDLQLRGTYLWYPPADLPLPLIELTGKLKFATADEDRDLGTGKNDFTLQIDLSKRFGDFTPWLSAGHRFVGKPSTGELRDSYFASTGTSLRVGSRLSLGLLYDWFQASSSRRHDSHQAVVYASVYATDRLRVGPYLVAGIAGYVPDYAMGFSLRYDMPTR